MPTNKSDILPSLVLSGPVSVPGMGSIIVIDAVIHSSAALNEASVYEEWQVCNKTENPSKDALDKTDVSTISRQRN